MSDSSSEENVVVPPKVAAAPVVAKAAVDSDSSSDDEPAPKPKAAAAPVVAKAKAAVPEDSSSEEEVVAAKPMVKAAAPPPVADSDSESDSPHKGQVAPKVQAAADDSDDSDDEVTVAPKAKPVPHQDAHSSSEEDEPMEQVKAAQTNHAKNQTVKAKAKLDAAVEEPKQSSTVNTKQKGDDDTEDLRVIIKGLPFKANEAGLKKDFSSCGGIKHVKLLLDDKGLSRGIAFIVFASSAGVDAALQRDGDKDKYKGRTLSVARAEKRKGPPPGADFQKAKRPEQSKDKDGKRKREEGGSSGSTADPNAIVNKDTIQQMLRLQDAKDFSSLEKMGAKIVKLAQAAQERARQQQGSKKKRLENTVFVKGLPHTEFNEEAFQRRFQDCGDVKFVWLPLKADGQTKGFGTIAFKTEEGFQKALKYDGTKCKGTVLSVMKSEPAKQTVKPAGDATPSKEGSETKAAEQTPKRKKPSTEEVSSSEVAVKKKQKTEKTLEKAAK